MNQTQTVHVHVHPSKPAAPPVQRIHALPQRELSPVLIPIAGAAGITLCFLGALAALFIWALS